MRALFVGGVVDNSEMDLEGSKPPVHYPEDTGGGHARYQLHQVGKAGDGSVVYAVYGAPDWTYERVSEVAEERKYATRFDAQASAFEH